jgi:hypothetical protein
MQKNLRITAILALLVILLSSNAFIGAAQTVVQPQPSRFYYGSVNGVFPGPRDTSVFFTNTNPIENYDIKVNTDIAQQQQNQIVNCLIVAQSTGQKLQIHIDRTGRVDTVLFGHYF